MFNSQEYIRLLHELVRDSPITSEDARKDLRELIYAGEYDIAFNFLCTWMDEDELAIDSGYYQRLLSASEHLGSEDLVKAIGEELVQE